MGEMIPLAAAVFLHEAGHLAAARLLKIPLRKGPIVRLSERVPSGYDTIESPAAKISTARSRSVS